ncbi:MAG TPA: serine hydrolase domain-containing protein [Gemmatimonadaceae bacterium]|nr:serine hydrolase domain-containing protein [Gemmatimonadaceae bacterium]
MRRPALVLALFVASAGPAAAQESPGVGRWVDSVFAPFSRRNAPGCAVGVVRDGAIVYSKGFGEANTFTHARNSPSTAFYLASLSKQFTAMSILLLEQDGKLRLGDDIRRWVPEVPKLGRITLRDLLQHTSGLRDYYGLLSLNGWRANELLTERELLDLVSRQRALNFTPGTEFLYSNTGYALLSVVVRRASGKSLRDFAEERIFRPLGMRNTQFRDDHTRQIDGEAIGYLAQGAGYAVSIPQMDVVGDGGVFSTVEDLARWDSNFTSAVVGGPEGMKRLQQPGVLADGRSTGYALGLSVGMFSGSRVVSHSGAYGGYRSTFLRFPDDRLTVITLCNVSTMSSQLAEQVANIYLGGLRVGDGAFDPFPSTMPRYLPPVSGGLSQLPDPDEQVWLEGKYFSEELDMEVTIRSAEGKLVMGRPMATDLTFSRVTRDLFTTSDQVTLKVERDAFGTVSSFLLSTSRVRNLRFLKRSGIVGVLGTS